MSPRPEALVPGLRERKKLETRATVERCALELFDRKGFAHTTIPEIADAAGVSPRTVSSYFPAKEDLVFPEGAALFDRLADHLNGRAPGETTADALRRWIAELDAEVAHKRDLEALRRRVIDADEHLQAHGRGYMARGEQLVADAIAVDLGCAPGDLEARLASAATLAIFTLLGQEKPAVLRDGGSDPMALLDRALSFVQGGIRALQRPA